MIGATFLSCCMSAALIASTPHLLVDPSTNKAIDQKIEIRIEGLDPFKEAEIHAKAEDQKGILWDSHAKFKADAHGSVDISSSHPLDGSSYTSADSMGLFWSMLPASGDETMSFKCKDDTFLAEVELIVDGSSLEKQTIVRYLKTPEVQKRDVRENGLVGSLFTPKSDRPLPVIITLSGSNGGLGGNRAKLLASNGFAVFALGYFGVEGLPSNLQDIPLEYFEAAFAWLKNQPEVNSSFVGIYGASRGAELSLLLGSLFPNEVSAIVAVVPSSVVYGGLSETPVNAWLYKGKPIAPFAPVPKTDFTNGKGETAENPANTLVQFLDGMKDADAFAKAAIPVEKIKCSILLISGGDDQMWPSEIYSTQIINRLKEKSSDIQAMHLNYPNAGHGINIPNLPIPWPTYYHPVGKLWFSMGGSREADAKASRESWNRLVEFFHQNLGNRGEVNITSNQEKFAHLRNFNLPTDQYAITGSGPLVIRNLKAIGDIDIIVSQGLWDDLAAQFGVADQDGVRKIVLPGEIVEAFHEGSFYTAPVDDKAPTIASRIAHAEIIDGLPFDSIENILYYKQKDAREKDLKDILLIEQWMREHKHIQPD